MALLKDSSAMRFFDGVERQIHGQQLANDRFIQKQRHKISPIQMDAKQQWTDFNGIPAHAGGHAGRVIRIIDASPPACIPRAWLHGARHNKNRICHAPPSADHIFAFVDS